MASAWQPDFIESYSLFELFTHVFPKSWLIKKDWPSIIDYNQHLANQSSIITNHNGQPIHCIQQSSKNSEFINSYEPNIYLRGELLTRAENWHDFFNLLVWLAFPKIKATINYWQYHLLKQRLPANTQRTPLENKLTHLDENGVIVVSCNPYLIDLLKRHCWQTLFWQQRAAVQTEMRFFIIGHALYEKALNPYIGMTGSALIFMQPQNFFIKSLLQQLIEMDKQVSAWLLQKENAATLAKLTPVPILGVPGWWPDNESLSFYENTNYFRSANKVK